MALWKRSKLTTEVMCPGQSLQGKYIVYSREQGQPLIKKENMPLLNFIGIIQELYDANHNLRWDYCHACSQSDPTDSIDGAADVALASD